MALASIHIVHNTVQNYIPFWILVYKAVSCWYIPPVQYQLCIYVCYINKDTRINQRKNLLKIFTSTQCCAKRGQTPNMRYEYAPTQPQKAKYEI